MISTVNRTLELRPDTINGIGMHVTPNIFLHGMFNNLMIESMFRYIVITSKIICHKVGFFFHVLLNQWEKGLRFNILNDLCPYLSFSFYHTKDRGFTFRTTTAFTFMLTTYISFINLEYL